MAKLVKLNEIEDQILLDEILDSDLVIFEDVQGSKIYVGWDGKEFIFKSRSVNSDPINLVDLAMQNYYNKAIQFFNSLDERIKNLLNRKWWFGFEYFPDTQPANIEYSRMPKNNLVLSSICKNGKYEYTFEELEEYARLFDVDAMPVIFIGKLGEESKEALKYFLNTSEADLDFVFGEQSFAFFFYKILNPQTTHSFLMDGEFQKNVERFIIRLRDKDVSFELLNPLYKRISETNTTDFVEIYTLVLINFLNFCQSVDLSQLKLKANKRDEAYLSIICKLFNLYMVDVKDDILKFDFTVPEFFDKDKFRVNVELINNKLTREYIEEDKKLEYIFKIILGSFNKIRKKPIGVFTDNTVRLFNQFVQEIQKHIDVYFKKRSEVELTKSGLMDFGQYFDIPTYDVDGDGQVYPDVYQELEKGRDLKSKKKEIPGKKMDFEETQEMMPKPKI